jgi:hypothetical protein
MICPGMTGIVYNTVSGVTASSQHPEYPVDNVLDDHPKKVWMSDNTGMSSLTFYIDEETDAITLFGTNAIKILFHISDPNGIEWEILVEWDSETGWSNNVGYGTGLFELYQNGDTYAIWLDIDPVSIPLEVTMELVAADDAPVEVGILWTGKKVEMDTNPSMGLNEGLIDYSITKELSNGAIWVKDRDIVRYFSGEIDVIRERKFYEFLYGIARNIGQNPIPWKITNLNTTDWILFGKFDSMPSGSHYSINNTRISFAIKEVL